MLKTHRIKTLLKTKEGYNALFFFLNKLKIKRRLKSCKIKKEE